MSFSTNIVVLSHSHLFHQVWITFNPKEVPKICSLEDKYVLIDPKTLYEKETSIQAIHPLVIATYMENLALLDGANVISY